MTEPQQPFVREARDTASLVLAPAHAAPGEFLAHDWPIFLVGMMGAGKTTVGKHLAKALSREFVDLDHELEARCGVKIPMIFEIEGEQGFRKRERQVLADCSQRRGIVLATGGGAVLAQENRKALSERGIVIYLRAGVDELFRRTSRDRNRPLLATADPRATLESLLAFREPLYAQVADIIVETGAASIAALAQHLIEQIQASPKVANLQAKVLPPAMHTVKVATPGGHYPIHIAPGRLAHLAHSIPADATSIALITNPNIDRLLGEKVKQVLAQTGCKLISISLPDGEAYKTFETLNLVFDAMLGAKLDRRTVIVALGGGVIGDMAGFAAATYMRGVRFVQVPTTLLAQVDSSVGGKTAVNHPHGKNMIGAFYQPIAVEIDTDVLNSLPERELSAGLAEVIKYGLILDAEFFSWCEKNVLGLRARDPDLLATAIQRSCEFKAYVVSKDERETGMRANLNLGHTFGHAIEAGLGYGQWLHGEAVGCGLLMAADLSAEVFGFPRSDVDRVRSLVQAIGCPTVGPRLGGISEWTSLMLGDKKAEAGEIQFVLMPKLGQAVRCKADAALVAKVIERNTA